MFARAGPLGCVIYLVIWQPMLKIHCFATLMNGSLFFVGAKDLGLTPYPKHALVLWNPSDVSRKSAFAFDNCLQRSAACRLVKMYCHYECQFVKYCLLVTSVQNIMQTPLKAHRYLPRYANRLSAQNQPHAPRSRDRERPPATLPSGQADRPW